MLEYHRRNENNTESRLVFLIKNPPPASAREAASGLLQFFGHRSEIAMNPTDAGRLLRGTLAEVNPAYTHGFDLPIPELATIGSEVRAILRRRGRLR